MDMESKVLFRFTNLAVIHCFLELGPGSLTSHAVIKCEGSACLVYFALWFGLELSCYDCGMVCV